MCAANCKWHLIHLFGDKHKNTKSANRFKMNK